jgi:hypothetical protein
MVAFGTTAPLWSVMVPVSMARSVCDQTGKTMANTKPSTYLIMDSTSGKSAHN